MRIKPTTCQLLAHAEHCVVVSYHIILFLCLYFPVCLQPVFHLESCRRSRHQMSCITVYDRWMSLTLMACSQPAITRHWQFGSHYSPDPTLSS